MSAARYLQPDSSPPFMEIYFLKSWQLILENGSENALLIFSRKKIPEAQTSNLQNVNQL